MQGGGKGRENGEVAWEYAIGVTHSSFNEVDGKFPGRDDTEP